MRLLLINDHFCYINDLDKATHTFACPNCHKMWTRSDACIRHTKTCHGEPSTILYPNGVFRPYPTPLEQLREAGYNVPTNYVFPYRICWDFEAMLAPVATTNTKTNFRDTDTTQYTTQHVPLSVSVISNVDNYTEPKFFVSNGDSQDLIDRTLDYMRKISDKSFEILKQSDEFRDVLKQLNDDVKYKKEQEEKAEKAKQNTDDTSQTNYKKDQFDVPEIDPERLRDTLLKYLRTIKCVAFNSSHYDINMIKSELFTNLTTVDETPDDPEEEEEEEEEEKEEEEEEKKEEEKDTRSRQKTRHPSQSFKRKRSSSPMRPLSKQTLRCLKKKKMMEKKNTKKNKHRSSSSYSFCSSSSSSTTSSLDYTRVGNTPFFPVRVVKANNVFKMIQTSKLKFLDVKAYLAPTCSYSQYLKAFDVPEQKGFFPYEWLDDINKLKYDKLPPKEAFYSSLKRKHITDEDYAIVQQAWKEHNMKTVLDLLRWYNHGDTKGFILALQKQVDFYATLNLDMLSSSVGLPGLTLRYLFNTLEPHIYFSLLSKRHSDLHQLLRQQLVGGPSLIFHRLLESGKTHIRNGKKIVQRIAGFDANGLYLWALQQRMPTQHPIRRLASNGFKAMYIDKYTVQSREWLTWLSQHPDPNLRPTCKLRTKFNGPEKRLGKKHIAVDGYDSDTKTVYNFQGCYWHGCICYVTNYQTFNIVKNKSMAALALETQDTIDYLEKTLKLKVIQIRECEWKTLKRQDPTIQPMLDKMCPQTTSAFTKKDEVQGINTESVVRAIQADKLFGLVQCDIHVPHHLKDTFSEFQPIFKNTLIGRDDLQFHMKTYCEKHKLLNKPVRTLIGSFFGSKIMLATPLIQWYLHHGLIITHVYQIVEYHPNQCFVPFATTCTNNRREADKDKTKAILGESSKLLANSAYGKTLTNIARYHDVSYIDNSQAPKHINDVRFKALRPLTDHISELEMAPKFITWDLPLQIGFFVYQYAKLRMLEFYYDCLDRFVDRSDFVMAQMDTDSAYIALSKACLEDAIKPELQKTFFQQYDQWFPALSCQKHKQQFIKDNCDGKRWKPGSGLPCCIATQQYEKRSLGKFKLEYEGENIVSLCSKTYYATGNSDKISSKGLQKSKNTLTEKMYKQVLETGEPGAGTNIGFITDGAHVFTYLQKRKSLSYLYIKRHVAEDGVTTFPTHK